MQEKVDRLGAYASRYFQLNIEEIANISGVSGEGVSHVMRTQACHGCRLDKRASRMTDRTRSLCKRQKPPTSHEHTYPRA